MKAQSGPPSRGHRVGWSGAGSGHRVVHRCGQQLCAVMPGATLARFRVVGQDRSLRQRRRCGLRSVPAGRRGGPIWSCRVLSHRHHPGEGRGPVGERCQRSARFVIEALPPGPRPSPGWSCVRRIRPRRPLLVFDAASSVTRTRVGGTQALCPPERRQRFNSSQPHSPPAKP